MGFMPYKTPTAAFTRSIAILGVSIGAAQAAAPDDATLMKAVEKVVAEHKVYATCLSLEPTSYRIVHENWTREVSQGAEALKALNPSPALVARYIAAVDSARLIDKTMTLAAAMAYCEKNAAQVKKFHEFGFSRLSEAINAAFKPKQRS